MKKAKVKKEKEYRKHTYDIKCYSCRKLLYSDSINIEIGDYDTQSEFENAVDTKFMSFNDEHHICTVLDNTQPGLEYSDIERAFFCSQRCELNAIWGMFERLKTVRLF